MTIVDLNGLFELVPGTLKSIESDHPVYQARIALALPAGAWMYAPTQGHDITFARAKSTDQNQLQFQKSLELYLKPYGPEVLSRLSERGELVLQELVTKETI